MDKDFQKTALAVLNAAIKNPSKDNLIVFEIGRARFRIINTHTVLKAALEKFKQNKPEGVSPRYFGARGNSKNAIGYWPVVWAKRELRYDDYAIDEDENSNLYEYSDGWHSIGGSGVFVKTKPPSEHTLTTKIDKDIEKLLAGVVWSPVELLARRDWKDKMLWDRETDNVWLFDDARLILGMCRINLKKMTVQRGMSKSKPVLGFFENNVLRGFTLAYREYEKNIELERGVKG